MILCLSRDAEGADVIAGGTPVAGQPGDISQLGSNWEIVLHVLFLTPDKKALFHIHDSVDSFSTSLPGPTFNPCGEVKSMAPIKFVTRAHEFPSLRFGQPNAQLRLDLVALDSGANIRYSGFIRTPD